MAVPHPKKPSYVTSLERTNARGKLKWIALASFLSAITAVLAVSLMGFLLIFLTNILLIPFLPSMGTDVITDSTGGPFFAGLRMAGILSALNWFLVFITLPAAWLALGLSIGRLPGKGVASHKRYFFWACLWGIILVGSTTTVFGLNLGTGSANPQLLSALGAMIGGVLVGFGAGAACAVVFLTIVRPNQQLANIQKGDLSVFD